MVDFKPAWRGFSEGGGKRAINDTHKMNISTSDAGLFAAVAVLAALFSAIFWMVVGWRAMRAHERIADSVELGVMKYRENDK